MANLGNRVGSVEFDPRSNRWVAYTGWEYGDQTKKGSFETKEEAQARVDRDLFEIRPQGCFVTYKRQY